MIRSTRPGQPAQYFMSHNIWTTNPVDATIFAEEESGFNVLCDHLRILGRLTGETFDVVPLFGCLQLPQPRS